MIEEKLVRDFVRIVGEENALRSRELLKAYSYDGTTNWSNEPDLVLLPTAATQVADIVRLANEKRIPVTPRGTGSSVSGGPVPIRGGIVLCTSRMNKVLKVDRENERVIVEPGVGLLQLNIMLGRDGLFFPPDPQSMNSATIGGMIAENAGGPSCLKYGVTKHYVLGLEVVLPSGDTIDLGKKALYHMNSPGYDVMHLIISSEGTLGIVTKAELKVMRLPAARNTVVATYDDVAVAAGAVSRILENGLIPCKIEYIDNWVINRFEDMMQVGLPRDADAVLLIEVVGSQEDTLRDTKKIVEIAKQYGARDVRPARDAAEANRFWEARRAGFSAVYGAARTVLAEDVTVPRGKIPDMANSCKELAKKYGVEIVVLGHAGDGNLHPAILTDINDKEHYDRATKALDEIFAKALELGGVISGEHGIGLEKARIFSQTVDPVAINMMKAVKKLFDPNDIMNPGKIWV